MVAVTSFSRHGLMSEGVTSSRYFLLDDCLALHALVQHPVARGLRRIQPKMASFASRLTDKSLTSGLVSSAPSRTSARPRRWLLDDGDIPLLLAFGA